MVSDQNKALLRAFADTFPALKIALKINDLICYLLNSFLKCLFSSIKYLFNLILTLIKKFFSKLVRHIPALDYKTNIRYERLRKKGKKQHDEPIPYENDRSKRFLTYHCSLILGTILYIFVYYVLVKHSTYFTIAVGLLLLLAYLLVLENSHNIRSIIMLCLPIMFTNRGRALVFCCMLAIMVSGPLKNGQHNINELHSSLNCCRQYLIIKGDKFVDKNVVQGIMRVEDIIQKLVEHIEEFAKQLKDRFTDLLHLGIIVERYIAIGIEKIKEIINVCNRHTEDVFNNCQGTFKYAYKDCKDKLGAIDLLCEIVYPLTELCKIVRLPDFLCEIPKAFVRFIDNTIGKRLKASLDLIENEFYFRIKIDHDYSFNGTKTKTFKQTFSEIKNDVKQKFWYIHLVNRIFNLISLILVVWILTTATLYQMNYLTELNYDNMYADEFLKDIDKFRKEKYSIEEANKKKVSLNAIEDEVSLLRDSLPREVLLNDDDEPIIDGTDENSRDVEKSFLFPMPKLQERKYPKPFSLRMNDEESHKLCIAGLIWALIVGYIFFHVLLDFSLYKLIELIQGILRDILFNSDLPLVDISSKTSGDEIRYNRTHLHQLRARLKLERLERISSQGSRSLSGLYRKLMDSIEDNIPDDVAILDSLELCLPKASLPNYTNYKNLSYLALFTFGAVIVEAYALRTRHCIANLFYPNRAKIRAGWLYHKLLKEKPKFSVPENLEKETGTKALEFGLKHIADRIKR